MKLKQFQLKNGLKVLFVESHKSPVCSVQMWVRTGSADEKKSEEGISHFIEHLVFKGTKKYGVGEIASTVEGAGGELNAYTSFDQTVFYVTVSSQFSDTALDVVSEMMGFPLFDAKEIDNEREVVIEEIKRGEDSPHRKASQLLFKTAFKKHPYGIPVIGYSENIREMSAQKIQKFYKDRYSPRNMFLVVAGDFQSPEMKKKVEKFFGVFKDNKIRSVKRNPEPLQKKNRIEILETQFKESMIYTAWKAPHVRHKDVPALDVLALILGQGDSSRLVQRLRIDAPVAQSVGAFTFTPQDEGIFSFSAGLDALHLPQLLHGFLAEIESVLNEPVSGEELQKALTNLASEQVYSMETVDGIARKVGSLEFYMKDPQFFPKYLKLLYALTPKDILRVARKYITTKTLNIIVSTDADKKTIQPELEKFVAELARIEKRVQKTIPPIKKVKLKKLSVPSRLSSDKPRIESFQLSGGTRVVLRQQKETPTLSLRLALLGGLRFEKEADAGITEMISRIWMAGTKNRTEAEINHTIDALAASFSPFSGRNSLGLSFDFLSPSTKTAAELLEDVLLNPLWDENCLERERKILYQQIKNKNDNPAQVCVGQFMERLFRGHPYSREIWGTPETLKNLNRQKLISYYGQVFNSSNMTICLVGDLDFDFWKKSLEKLSRKIPQGKKQTQELKIEKIEKEERIFRSLEREQSHIIFGYRSLTLTDPRRYTLQIIQSILAGQGGRLFYELRDKNSLAYSVSPMKMEGVDTGYFGAYIGCSPEKADKAIEMIRIEFQKLCDKRVAQDELLRAQKYIVGRHDIDLQRKSAVCNSILFDTLYGLDPEESFNSSDKYFSVTAEDIQKLSEEIFSQAAVISVVGPQAPKSFD